MDTATTPLYTPAWVKAMPLEERGVAVVAVVPAASSRVHNILEASRGVLVWVDSTGSASGSRGFQKETLRRVNGVAT